MNLPAAVKLVEVGPRDGLQNEGKLIPTQVKVEFINRLSETGLQVIEATSFVSPKWIPQLADHAEVYEKILKKNHISYPVMVFNKQGLDNAIASNVKQIAVFTTPSEQFCKRNANCTVSESLDRIQSIIEMAEQEQVMVRAYISCVLGCPFEGKISPAVVSSLVKTLLSLGCYEVSLGDTIGIGTPLKTEILLNAVLQESNVNKIAIHFHDTYGQALANIYAALRMGIHIIDSSVAGLGGCPYAKGATGNVATEDVLYMLNEMGIQTGVDLDKLIKVGLFITQYLQRDIRSKVSIAKIAQS